MQGIRMVWVYVDGIEIQGEFKEGGVKIPQG